VGQPTRGVVVHLSRVARCQVGFVRARPLRGAVDGWVAGGGKGPHPYTTRRLRGQLFDEFKTLPEADRTRFIADARAEQALGKRRRSAASSVDRNTSALWNLSTDDMPVDISRISQYIRDQYGAHDAVCLSKLTQELRAAMRPAMVVRDTGAIPKTAHVWSRAHCGLLHPGLCISRDREIVPAVRAFASRIHKATREDLQIEVTPHQSPRRPLPSPQHTLFLHRFTPPQPPPTPSTFTTSLA